MCISIRNFITFFSQFAGQKSQSPRLTEAECEPSQAGACQHFGRPGTTPQSGFYAVFGMLSPPEWCDVDCRVSWTQILTPSGETWTVVVHVKQQGTGTSACNGLTEHQTKRAG